jgi:hypothetical protein
MKLASLALAGLLSSCLCLLDSAVAAEPEGESSGPAAEPLSAEPQPGDADRDESAQSAGSPVFVATIITGNRSREFDSPARAMSELQRAVWLNRRARQDELDFQAVLTINGVEHEFSSPDEARAACHAVIEALRRLTKVRATLEDIGSIPAAKPSTSDRDDSPSERPSASREQALLTIRQRVNEALRQEVRRNQGRLPDQERWQQILAEQMDRARRDGLVGHDAPAPAAEPQPATVALEARKHAEIVSVRHMLARAFSTASREDAEAAAETATAQIKPAE